MKIKHIILAAAALLGALTSCKQKEEDLGPAGIKTDVTALEFTADGGSKTIDFVATRDWNTYTEVDWIVFTPAKGAASTKSQSVEVSVLPNAQHNRQTVVKVTIGLADALITVKQEGQLGEKTLGTGTLDDPYSVAGANAVIEAGTYTADKVYTKGIISQIKEVDTGSYGNATYFISDDGTTEGQLEIYRGYSLGGAKFKAADEIKTGDEVIVFGALVNYSGTFEVTQGSQIYSLNGQTSGTTPGTPATPATPENAIYYNNFDKAAATKTYGSGSSWPYLDQTDCWNNGAGSGAAAVTYAFNAVSARNNSTSNSEYSDYAGSGTNNLFFGTSAYFAVKGIALGGKTNLTLSFGTEKYLQNADNTFANSEFHVYVSADAQKWVEIAYAFPNGPKDGRWDKASSTFTVPAGTTSLSIYVKSDLASAHRLDDLTLLPSETAGTAIDFSKGIDIDAGGDNPGGNDPGTVTPPAGAISLADFLASEDNTQATVADVYVAALTTKGYVITDGKDNVYVYANSAPSVKIGDKINLTGTKTTYYGLPEITGPTATTVSSGNTVPYPTVQDITATFDSYQSSKADYITFTATVYKDGSYTNFRVEGATARVGSLSSAPSTMYNGLNEGDKVQVTGFFNTFNTSKTPNLLSVIAVSVTKDGENPGGNDNPGTNPPTGDASEFTSNVTWVLGENAYDKTSSGTSAQTATINGVAVDNLLKLGKSSAAGTATITLPKGTSKITFYGVSWSGKEASLYVTAGGAELMTQRLAPNAGATGNAPYTMTVAASDKYTKAFDAPLAADTQVTVTTTGTNYRVILFGIKAE